MATTSSRGHPAPPIARSQQALIHDNAFLTGTHPITIGADAIIQLRAKIISAHGPVTIGDGCVVAERAVIGLVSSLGAEKDKGWGGEVILGNGVIVESGAVVEGKMLGEGTIVEVGAVVGRGSVLGKHCKISPLCSISPYDILPDHTVVYGNNERRIEPLTLQHFRTKLVEKHVEALKAIMEKGKAKVPEDWIKASLSEGVGRLRRKEDAQGLGDRAGF